jgi:hypothetical protein
MTRWLKREVAAPGPHMTLCLSEKEFLKAMKYLKIKRPPQWINDGATATTTIVTRPSGKKICVVSVKDWEGANPVGVASTLVHEAVHIWQEYAERIGEKVPGDEQEAYAVQWISHTLMKEFARRMKKGKRK